MRTLVAVGACYLDTILTVEHYPAEDGKIRASTVTQRRGGNTANTLEVLQQLLVANDTAPWPCLALLVALPSAESVAVEKIYASLENVEFSYCFYREDHLWPASSYVINSLAANSRTIVSYNELPEMTSKEFVSSVDRMDNGEKWFHFEGRIPDVTLECLHHVRSRHPNATISVEVEKPGRAGLEHLAAVADIVFYSKSWAEGQGHKGPEDCLRAQAPLTPNASLLCCTWGEDGASALEVHTSTYSHVPSILPEGLKVVDTLGAGDTFIAGMLFALIYHETDWETPRKLAFANELAGRKVAQEGFSGLGTKMLPRR